MSPQGASSSSSSSSTPQQSFRKNFVELVLVVWRWMGVWLFRKNEEIERGKSISPELVKEKEESRFVFMTLLKKRKKKKLQLWSMDLQHEYFLFI